ncbi:hypothetical protein R3P38DRAFT_3167004 [Favolaschia claudopus]|uniref:Uncharacterized protein n=1 Tax=Favolaschia claudopus TaxID=2862362 RepID=A0AAW0ED00_9AGAR
MHYKSGHTSQRGQLEGQLKAAAAGFCRRWWCAKRRLGVSWRKPRGRGEVTVCRRSAVAEVTIAAGMRSFYLQGEGESAQSGNGRPDTRPICSDRPPPDSDPPSSSTGSSVLDPPTESAQRYWIAGSLQTAEEIPEDLDSTRQTPNPDPPLEDDISETHSPPESSSSPNSPETTLPPLSEMEKQLMDENIQYLQ